MCGWAGGLDGWVGWMMGCVGMGGWMGEAELIGGGEVVGGRIRTLISTTSGRRRTLISKRLSTLISKTGTAGYVGYVGIDGVLLVRLGLTEYDALCTIVQVISNRWAPTGDLQQVISNRWAPTGGFQQVISNR
jgi:hypothetical protein